MPNTRLIRNYPADCVSRGWDSTYVRTAFFRVLQKRARAYLLSFKKCTRWRATRRLTADANSFHSRTPTIRAYADNFTRVSQGDGEKSESDRQFDDPSLFEIGLDCTRFAQCVLKTSFQWSKKRIYDAGKNVGEFFSCDLFLNESMLKICPAWMCVHTWSHRINISVKKC